MTESLRNFIREHLEDDPSELLLHAARYSDVDVNVAIVQIKARLRVKDKLPTWFLNDRLIFPSTLASEQCSSEITASYKQRLVQYNDFVCDLTGGLGVDTCFFAQKVRRTTYIEQDETCCNAGRNNFPLLGFSAIQIIHGDAVAMIANNDERIGGANVFYMDPARRGENNKRLYAISDCEPDPMKIIPLLPKPYRIIVKLSPMLDVKQAIKQIPGVCEVHIVSVKNDCKELLVVAEGLPESVKNSLPDNELVGFMPQHKYDPEIFCVNYVTDRTEQSFRFYLQEEKDAIVQFSKRMGRYLYEPDASVLKAGAYKSVVARYDVEKLHANSHLYTSDRLLNSFSGRKFEIIAIIPFSTRICKTLHVDIPKANIAVRNFPLSADELRKRTQISDGGEIYLFATTLSDNQKTLIKCRKI